MSVVYYKWNFREFKGLLFLFFLEELINSSVEFSKFIEYNFVCEIWEFDF